MENVIDTMLIFGNRFEVTKCPSLGPFRRQVIGTDKKVPIFVMVNCKNYLTKDGWVEGDCQNGWFRDMGQVHRAFYLYMLRNTQVPA